MVSSSRTITLANARIWTADAARPHATSISFRDGSIVALDEHASDAVDMQGAWIGPAFIDAHLHLTLGAATLDEKLVRSSTEAVAQATSELIRNRVDRIVAIRKQLSPAQWEQLKAIWQEDDDRGDEGDDD